jgi:hypothetical protein
VGDLGDGDEDSICGLQDNKEKDAGVMIFLEREILCHFGLMDKNRSFARMELEN